MPIRPLRRAVAFTKEPIGTGWVSLHPRSSHPIRVASRGELRSGGSLRSGCELWSPDRFQRLRHAEVERSLQESGGYSSRALGGGATVVRTGGKLAATFQRGWATPGWKRSGASVRVSGCRVGAPPKDAPMPPRCFVIIYSSCEYSVFLLFCGWERAWRLESC